MPPCDLDIHRTARLLGQLHGDEARAKAREMVERMRRRGDHDAADSWLRGIVAIGELEEPPTDAQHSQLSGREMDVGREDTLALARGRSILKASLPVAPLLPRECAPTLPLHAHRQCCAKGFRNALSDRADV
jgi:hypothetical protein